MKGHNVFRDVDMNNIKTIAQTAAGAYKGYKKGGLPGAIIGGLKAYHDATKSKPA